jgi:hypothetical protein
MEDSLYKPKRGRPPKYSPEERQEQYKNLSQKWCKKNYEQNSKELSSKSNTYQKRLREAYSLLLELWVEKESIADFKSQKYIDKLKAFFPEQQE